MIQTLESGLGERCEQSGGGMEGPELVLGWTERDERVDAFENKPLQYLRGCTLGWIVLKGKNENF